MPISRVQFLLGKKDVAEVESWMRQVYGLLASHPKSAYSYHEICQAIPVGAAEIKGSNHPTKNEKFDRALDALVELGAVDKREIDNAGYYAFLEAFDTQSWQRLRDIL